jgi:hypothetical protein
MSAETRVFLHANCPLYLSDLTYTRMSFQLPETLLKYGIFIKICSADLGLAHA